jgi:hypothetical protein
MEGSSFSFSNCVLKFTSGGGAPASAISVNPQKKWKTKEEGGTRYFLGPSLILRSFIIIGVYYNFPFSVIFSRQELFVRNFLFDKKFFFNFYIFLYFLRPFLWF